MHLLIVDAQNDFCHPSGAMFVPGAQDDMSRLSSFIHNNLSDIVDITVTLDSHHVYDLGHTEFWDDDKAKPFTRISLDQIESGEITPKDKEKLNWIKLYARKNSGVDIWPTHCVIGTWGHNIVSDVLLAVQSWELKSLKSSSVIIKGENPYTESYSAFEAALSIIGRHGTSPDKSTFLKIDEIARIGKSDTIVVAGEAGSHCIKDTVESFIENSKDMSAKKIILLEDAFSPVPSFEGIQDTFISNVKQLGGRILTTRDFEKERNG